MINKAYNENCYETMKQIPDNSIDSIITDPPYGISFMGKKWDYEIPSVAIWKECLRILKPGGYLLSFASPRTHHRMCYNIEDAGFEIRDMIAWIYSTGFPKSLNVGKAVDKLQGNDKEVVGKKNSGKKSRAFNDYQYRIDNDIYSTIGDYNITKGNSQWEGWGTALKPAIELITMARKPLSEKTVAKNVLKWGTGAINIDACRVETTESITNHSRSKESSVSKGKYGDSSVQETHQTSGQQQGRFPANIILDEESGKLLDEQSGESKSKKSKRGSVKSGNIDGRYNWNNGDKNDFNNIRGHNDNGGASRFFYCAKASRKERGEFNLHPTVKPIKLMQYLIKLVTPINGVVYDPFAGSGSTLLAAKQIGFNYVGSELSEEYFEIIKKRLKK